ncbi:hypothetical protein [Granulosicoccus antarcticus]|uniref:Glucosamine inositolphosphorylceramide transferase 1 N-terminal domain-containing protein n=1 Tax=Granulosicoccus antarcticus IMCC3135 TaxID=1192854 RepID=A0A2Z2P043_9GAMM|nr:hypothetical protein [Granulosicoccus antarcticus]ASJ75591.1 hypothetical protein IMCC3135_27690 [Granulosicoccus antarcticus IMCC3135]
MKQVLSVVAIIDSPTPLAWVNKLIDRLEQRNGVELSILLRSSDQADSKSGESLPDSLMRASGEKLLGKMDKPRFAQNPWQAEALSNTSALKKTDASTALVRCDVVINLSDSPLDPDMLPHGGTPVWDAHIETLDARIKDQLLQRAPLCWVHLWAHYRDPDKEASTPGTDSCSRIATHALPRQTYSITDLRRAAYFSLVSLFESRLVWLSQGANILASEYRQSTALPNGKLIDPERQAAQTDADCLMNNQFMPAAVSEFVRLKQLLKLFYHQSLDRIRHRLWYEQWQLAVINDTGTSSLAALTRHKLDDFAIIESPAKTWWADPHLYQHDGSLYVFFEEMQIDSDHAHLSVARLSHDGQPSEVKKVMDDGQHLSYPFVFSADGELYMIPETASRKSVLLYKAEQFPDQWTLVKELLNDVDLADSTVHFDGQRWWMFANAMSHRCVDERDELHLYYSDQITGSWTPHPMNPVITGVDRARMAGPVFRDGDHFYRPSQYGAVRYGYGINLARIEVLNTQAYSEVIEGRLLPEQGSTWLGCHSVTHMNGTTVLDRVTRHRR